MLTHGPITGKCRFISSGLSVYTYLLLIRRPQRLETPLTPVVIIKCHKYPHPCRYQNQNHWNFQSFRSGIKEQQQRAPRVRDLHLPVNGQRANIIASVKQQCPSKTERWSSGVSLFCCLAQLFPVSYPIHLVSLSALTV